MEALILRCCGLDLHKESMIACVLTGDADKAPEARMAKFGTTHDDFLALEGWLTQNGVEHVAMESTGVYWMAVYNYLTEQNITCAVVNARKVKNVPGRKTDWNDTRWIAQLYRHGLLSASYVPNRAMQALRTHTRALESLTQDQSREKNRVEKLLQAEGFRLSSVIEDIFSVRGLALLRVLAQKGHVRFADVQKHRNPGGKHSDEEFAKAMRGRLSDDLCRLLAFRLRRIEAYGEQIAELQGMINDLVEPYQAAVSIVDSVPGVGRQAAIDIIAEIGADVEAFQSAEQLASWAGICPRNSESAGKKSTRIMPGNRHLKRALNQCAWSCARARNASPLRAWFWSIAKRSGKKKAIVALCRKLLTIIYALLKSGTFFDPDHRTRPDAT